MSTLDAFPLPARAGLDLEANHLRAQREALVSELARVIAERDAYLRQLTDVQAECTRLVEVARAERSELRPLAERLVDARRKHPSGCHFHSIVEEVGEVARALRREPERVNDELLDVAVCAIRVFLGEVPEGPK